MCMMQSTPLPICNPSMVSRRCKSRATVGGKAPGIGRQAAYLGHNVGWRCCQPVAQPQGGGRLIKVTIIIAGYKGTARLKSEDCMP